MKKIVVCLTQKKFTKGVLGDATFGDLPKTGGLGSRKKQSEASNDHAFANTAKGEQCLLSIGEG
jgi:hypothetical protein